MDHYTKHSRSILGLKPAIIGLTLILFIGACSPNPVPGHDPQSKATVTRDAEAPGNDMSATPFVFEETPNPITQSTVPVPESTTTVETTFQKKAFVKSGEIQYKLNEQDLISVEGIKEIPIGKNVKISNLYNVAELELDDGSVLVLSPSTTFYIEDVEQSTTSHMSVVLESRINSRHFE